MFKIDANLADILLPTLNTLGDILKFLKVLLQRLSFFFITKHIPDSDGSTVVRYFICYLNHTPVL